MYSPARFACDGIDTCPAVDAQETDVCGAASGRHAAVLGIEKQKREVSLPLSYTEHRDNLQQTRRSADRTPRRESGIQNEGAVCISKKKDRDAVHCVVHNVSVLLVWTKCDFPYFHYLENKSLCGSSLAVFRLDSRPVIQYNSNAVNEWTSWRDG